MRFCFLEYVTAADEIRNFRLYIRPPESACYEFVGRLDVLMTDVVMHALKYYGQSGYI